MKKVFNIDNFIYLSIITMLFNSIAIFRVSILSQITSILLSGFGVISIYFSHKDEKWEFTFKGHVYSKVILSASILSFIANKLQFPVKNIYSIIAIVVNFYIFMSIYHNQRDYNKIYKMLLMIFVVTLTFTIINLLFFYYDISIPIGSYQDIRLQRFMGVDKIRHRVTGLSGNSNGLGRVALSSIISVLLLRMLENKTQNKMNRFLLIISIFLNVVVIIISQSRGTIISLMMLGIGYFLTIFGISMNKINRNRSIIYTSILFVLLTYSTAIYHNKLNSVLFNSINGTRNKVNKTINSNSIVDRNEREEDLLVEDVSNGRLTLIKNGLKATINAKPIFGLTYGGNKYQIQNYLDNEKIEVPSYIYSGAGSMHNTIVQFYVNIGLGGVGAFIFLLIRIGRILFNRTFIDDTIDIKIMSTLNAVLLSLLILNMVEWVFYFDYDNHLVNFLILLVFSVYLQGLDCEENIK